MEGTANPGNWSFEAESRLGERPSLLAFAETGLLTVASPERVDGFLSLQVSHLEGGIALTAHYDDRDLAVIMNKIECTANGLYASRKFPIPADPHARRHIKREYLLAQATDGSLIVTERRLEDWIRFSPVFGGRLDETSQYRFLRKNSK